MGGWGKGNERALMVCGEGIEGHWWWWEGIEGHWWCVGRALKGTGGVWGGH